MVDNNKGRRSILSYLYRYKDLLVWATFSLSVAGFMYSGIKTVNAIPYQDSKPKTEQVRVFEESELENFFRDMTPEQELKLLESSVNFEKLDKGKTVDEILEARYKEEPLEKKAYKAILSHREKLEEIASKYDKVSPGLVMAVIKKESQGLKYKRSRAGGTGPMQITYNGAFSFLYNTLTKKDPYFKNIKKTYKSQLDEINSELRENKILTLGKKGKQKTWKKLKDYFKEGRFPLNVNIGALYLDFLIEKFKSEELGLAAYNAGETAVRRVGRIPNYGETRRYVEEVIYHKNMFDKLLKAKS